MNRKLVRIIARLNTGGPARHVTVVSDRLAALGYDSLLIYGATGRGEGTLEHLAASNAFRSERIPALGRSLHPLDDLRALAAIIRALVREKPAIVHTHTSKAGALGRIAALVYNAARAGRRRSILVHTFHGHVFEGYFGSAGSWAARAVERLLASQSDAVVAISPLQAADLTRRYRIANSRKVHVIPLGLDLSAFEASADRAGARTSFGFESHDVVLGFVGRLVPIKAPGLLLQAFARARTRDRRLRLLIAGDGELRPWLEAQAASLGISADVRFIGWSDDLPRLYAAFDAVVLTSVNEGTPVALIEAAAAGLPVVSTAVGGVADVVTHGRHGWLTPPADANALADAFVDLAASAERRADMGGAFRREVLPRFNPERLAADLHRLYERCLRERHGAAAFMPTQATPGADA